MRDNSSTQAQQPTEDTRPTPNPALRSLDRLVGTWKVSGREIDGQISFEWLEGGFFLVQRFDLDRYGKSIKGIEIMGYGIGWDGKASEDCTSHMFDNEGHAFTYTWDVTGDILTIWAGRRGSPDQFTGKFSNDGNTITGAWEWPSGGYEATMTKIKEKHDGNTN